MITPAITPSRLALARKRRGLTLVRLAEATGVSTRSLSAYESGRQQPAPQTTRALARARLTSAREVALANSYGVVERRAVASLAELG